MALGHVGWSRKRRNPHHGWFAGSTESRSPPAQQMHSHDSLVSELVALLLLLILAAVLQRRSRVIEPGAGEFGCGSKLYPW